MDIMTGEMDPHGVVPPWISETAERMNARIDGRTTENGENPTWHLTLRDTGGSLSLGENESPKVWLMKIQATRDRTRGSKAPLLQRGAPPSQQTSEVVLSNVAIDGKVELALSWSSRFYGLPDRIKKVQSLSQMLKRIAAPKEAGEKFLKWATGKSGTPDELLHHADRAMYLAKQLTPRSLPEIGRKFGGRDHTTVIHAVRKIEELSAYDPSFREDVELLRRLLQS